MSDDAEQSRRKTFEPPPWEKEQFEELARRRAAEQAGGTSGAAEPGEAPAHERPATTVADERARQEAPDDKMTDALLVQLSGEERMALLPVRNASAVASWVLALVGVVVMGFGFALAWRTWGTGALGIIGGLMVVAMGGFIAGAGVWLWVRAGR